MTMEVPRIAKKTRNGIKGHFDRSLNHFLFSFGFLIANKKRIDIRMMNIEVKMDIELIKTKIATNKISTEAK